MSSMPLDFGRSSMVIAIVLPVAGCGETADGCDTKITKATKVTKKNILDFVIFVNFVNFVSAAVGRLSAVGRLNAVTTSHPPNRFFRTNVTLAGRSASRRMYH